MPTLTRFFPHLLFPFPFSPPSLTRNTLPHPLPLPLPLLRLQRFLMLGVREHAGEAKVRVVGAEGKEAGDVKVRVAEEEREMPRWVGEEAEEQKE